MKHLIKCLIYQYLLLGTFITAAQGWDQFYDSPGTDYVSEILTTPDDGYLIVGSDLTTLFIVRTNSRGDTIWSKMVDLIPDVFNSWVSEWPVKVVEKQNGHYIILIDCHDHYSPYDHFGGFIEMNQYGDIIWSKVMRIHGRKINIDDLELTANEEIIVSGRKAGFSPFVNAQSSYIAKYSPTGTFLWESCAYNPIEYIGGENIRDRMSGLMIDDDGTYIVISSSSTPAPFYPHAPPCYHRITLSRIDTNGMVLYRKLIDSLPMNGSFDIILSGAELTSDGGIIICGKNINNSYLVKIDSNENLSWTRTPNTSNSYNIKVQETADFGFVLIAHNPFGNLIKFSQDGFMEWRRTYGVNTSVFYALRQTEGNGFIIGGQHSPIHPDHVYGAMWVILTDSIGNIYTNKVYGRVAIDENNNCEVDTTELGVGSALIYANNGQHSAYTNSNADGTYELLLDTGIYDISIFPQGPYWDSCQGNQQAVFSGFYLDEKIDFALPIDVVCPFLEVNITTPFHRRCRLSNCYVSYCNKGTDISPNTVLEINLPPELTFSASSIPISQQVGNTLYYNLDTLGIGECGSLVLTLFVDCNATMGDWVCTQASISPDSFCNLRSPHLQVLDLCINDTVQFSIFNKGSLFTQSLPYWIIEDSIVIDTGWIYVNGSDTSLIQHHLFNANASCWLILSPNMQDYYAVSNVVNCNSFSSHHWPMQKNSNVFYDNDCGLILAAFDPNDKQAYPEGVGGEHFIFPKTALEYKIRFQNTGNDTAFRVVLVDTLSNSLDLTSLRITNSSHPFTWELYNDGILEVVYDNIMLPDSNVNEAGSHGFVSFMIEPKNGLPNGTRIENTALIYFDFNEPITTNTYHHTIHRQFLDIDILERIEPSYPDLFFVFPNPTSDFLTIRQYKNREASLELIHINGQLIFRDAIQSNEKTLRLTDLAQGAYILRIITDEGTQVFKIIKRA